MPAGLGWFLWFELCCKFLPALHAVVGTRPHVILRLLCTGHTYICRQHQHPLKSDPTFLSQIKFHSKPSAAMAQGGAGYLADVRYTAAFSFGSPPAVTAYPKHSSRWTSASSEKERWVFPPLSVEPLAWPTITILYTCFVHTRHDTYSSIYIHSMKCTVACCL